jgi:hypothetical protein
MQKNLSQQQSEELLELLKKRFEENINRHKDIEWSSVESRLESNPEKLWSIEKMESTGGEPDVVFFDKESSEYIFYDCSKETPRNRRNTTYDRKGQDMREKQGIQMVGNAIDMANEMGIELLTEEQYRKLQEFGEFDLKTSSWIKTPESIRNLGGALFCDRRYDTVFVYHNGAQSFYAARGFRGMVRV